MREASEIGDEKSRNNDVDTLQLEGKEKALEREVNGLEEKVKLKKKRSSKEKKESLTEKGKKKLEKKKEKTQELQQKDEINQEAEIKTKDEINQEAGKEKNQELLTPQDESQNKTLKQTEQSRQSQDLNQDDETMKKRKEKTLKKRDSKEKKQKKEKKSKTKSQSETSPSSSDGLSDCSSSFSFSSSSPSSSSSIVVHEDNVEESQSSQSPLEEIGTCCICFDTIYSGNEFRLDCGHTMCKECLLGYYSSEINDGRSNLRCPETECKKPVEGRTLLLLVGPDLYAKWDRFSLRTALARDENMRFCPGPDCNYGVYLEPTTFPKFIPFLEDPCSKVIITCQDPKCQTKFCAACGQKEHGGLSCSENRTMVSMLDGNQLDSDNIKPCPKWFFIIIIFYFFIFQF